MKVGIGVIFHKKLIALWDLSILSRRFPKTQSYSIKVGVGKEHKLLGETEMAFTQGHIVYDPALILLLNSKLLSSLNWSVQGYCFLGWAHPKNNTPTTLRLSRYILTDIPLVLNEWGEKINGYKEITRRGGGTPGYFF